MHAQCREFERTIIPVTKSRTGFEEGIFVNLKDRKRKNGFLASIETVIAEYRAFLKRVGNL